MKKLFYFSILALIAFEVLNVYFIMPFPGSQRINSIDTAYFLYSWRWVFRGVLGFLILIGAALAVRRSKWHLLMLVPLIVVAYFVNFKMSADTMFLEPSQVVMKNSADNTVAPERLILGVVENGEARAYPIQYIAYHHKVQDTVGGKPLLITYCTVCRTGRAFEPMIDGNAMKFRLVGMDRFNAMFEDAETKSWWRQANGKAIEGKLTGKSLPEIDSTQTTLKEWLALYPDTLIMQPDPAFAAEYASYDDYENGQGGELTGRNTEPWQDKSWVVGIEEGSAAKAFDWNSLQKQRFVNIQIGETPIALVLASDNKSFFAFKRPQADAVFKLDNDQIIFDQLIYDLSGKPINHSGEPLQRVNAYQEFWHSWKTFHPNTTME